MRKAVALIAGLAVLAFVNFGIYGRERLLTEGQVVLLRMAPVDPRSLMQGDYMRLNFEAADAALLHELQLYDVRRFCANHRQEACMIAD